MTGQFTRVTLPNTEVRTLTSKHNNQEYRLFISFPDGYHASDDAYPVLYVTDGNWSIPYFASVSFKWHPIPPMLVVAIGYPTESVEEISRLRERDFLPTNDAHSLATLDSSAPQPGGAPQFLSFIREELFEFVDANYRTLPEQRAFFGFSFGGTFGTYVLFNQPNTFTQYIIGAPVLAWADQICFQYESQFAARSRELPVKVYFAVGTLDKDIMDLLVQFQAIIQGRDYQGLEMKLEIFEGEDHITAAGPTISRGIRAVSK